VIVHGSNRKTLEQLADAEIPDAGNDRSELGQPVLDRLPRDMDILFRLADFRKLLCRRTWRISRERTISAFRSSATKVPASRHDGIIERTGRT
jgi:hypothetical protein